MPSKASPCGYGTISCQSKSKPVAQVSTSTYVLEGVDSLCRLLDLTTNNLRDQLGGQLGERAAGCLSLNDLEHLLADRADLRRRGVGGLLDLVGSALGEGNGEKAEKVVVGGLDGDIGLDQGLSLADQRAELVRCEVETVEVGEARCALDLINSELDLAESVVLVLLQIGQGNLDDTTLQGIVGVFETGCPVHESLSDTKPLSARVLFPSELYVLANVEAGGSLDRVPVFASERILGLLLKALLAL